MFTPGIHVEVPTDGVNLENNATSSTKAKIWADNTAPETATVVLRLDSETKTGWVKCRFSEAKPVLTFTPNFVETGIATGQMATENVTIKNSGLEEMKNIKLQLLTGAGGEAPSWITLGCANDVASLAVGESREIPVAFSPAAGISEGDYPFKLRVTADDVPARDINLFCAVTQSGKGKVLFKLSDIYTGTARSDASIIQGLAGARIKIQNESVLSESYDLPVSDNIGESISSLLPAGRYICRISADKHDDYSGRFTIKPGVTTNMDVFLEYKLVTVEWSVNEITIQPRRLG